MTAGAQLPTPALALRDGTPVSTQFEDVYFSREGGIAETEHVFLRGNHLPAGWTQAPRFTIGELGFGTGLNFLVTWQHFCATAPEGAVLHYHAVEKYPLRREALAEILTLHSALADEVAALLAVYPLPLPGPHRIHLPRAVLTLWFGDVADWLASMRAVDAWYLDGFSPAKNQAMWHESVLHRIAHASAPGASFATFTAASAVRRGLEAAGFAVEKTQGFAHKREMLRGALPLATNTTQTAASPTRTIIIGAGIAGASLAHALALRGHCVTVLERSTVASGASGNEAGVLFPPLTKHWTRATAFYFTAYAFMLRSIRHWESLGLRFPSASPGMLRLPRHEADEDTLRHINERLGLDPTMAHWVERAKASRIAGLDLPTGAAYFPQGSWLSPHELCHALLQHPRILLREQTVAESLHRTSTTWRLALAHGEHIEADQVCITSAVESKNLLPEYEIPLQPVGGQITEIAAGDIAAPLRSILCRKGYVIPTGAHYLVGATYHREDWLSVTAARHEENLAELAQLLPGWHRGAPMAGRSSIRATTPDRLPLVGALAKGLYLSAGHGSRGLLSAPLAGEIIASLMEGEPSPVCDETLAMLDPRRFRKASAPA